MEKNIFMIIIIAIITSVVTALVVNAFVGNSPSLAPVYGSGVSVYTKAEIDSSLANVLTKTEANTLIDARLDKCTTWTTTSADKNTVYGNMTCNQSCKQNALPGTNSPANQKCLWAGLLGSEKNEFGGETQDLRIIDKGACSISANNYFDGGYKQVTCFCC